MDTITEIIKYTFPALIVFATVYFMMKYHYRNWYSIEMAKLRNDSAKTTLALRLQAYERLALFCERISPENLLLRIKNSSMNGQELQNLLFIAIKQEYDHNLTQQVYVSEQLWSIIELSKNQVMQIISMSYEASVNKDSDSFAETLVKAVDEKNPTDMALKAIRKEVEMYFN
ncbi:MAG: hypothetical protein IPH57_06525 [Saprospiraceae bacterium]|nr:hypothetical protein [Saprospiraceae bacterium]